MEGWENDNNDMEGFRKNDYFCVKFNFLLNSIVGLGAFAPKTAILRKNHCFPGKIWTICHKKMVSKI